MWELEKKIALLHEIAKQNRIVQLRLKYNKEHNKQVKQLLKKQIENLQKED